MDDKQEQRRAYMREYYKQNREKFRPKSPEKRAEYNENRRAKYASDPAMQQQYRDAARDWQSKNPRKRADQRMRKYGISIDDYESMLGSQGGKCAICLCIPSGKLHVDHCHSTGFVRGLLCEGCNHGLGKFKDSAESLARAIGYLESAKERASSD